MKEIIGWGLGIFFIGGGIIGGMYVLIEHLKFKKWL